MVDYWESEEYSHGYLIPFISIGLVWENRASLVQLRHNGHWAGCWIVLLGLILGLLGDLSTLFTITQYAFLITLIGFCVTLLGFSGLKILWFPIAYLIFMIPLPNFFYNNLSSYLQLISSSLGVAVIRFFNISVFLEGNVIDLGTYQLQVVEACSGLRYLFPLTSFGFLCCYFFRAKLWMRLVVFLSTLPITVFMNSFRVGMIGILVDHWGIAQAEGFLHYFEGWVIFIGCLVILFMEMWLLTKLFIKDKHFSEVFVVGVDSKQLLNKQPNTLSSDQKTIIWGVPKPFLVTIMLLLLAVPLTFSISDRKELTPARSRFATFPLQISDWHGVELGIGQEFVDTLKFDDYILANYTQSINDVLVNFYVAYYASQRQGASAHSPKSCIPGDGWRIGDFSQKEISGVTAPNGQVLKVNRAMISKGGQKQLVYYWFQQRGRLISNEYLAKWYLFWDSLTRQRTDGALVRLVVVVNEKTSATQADQILENFTREIEPVLKAFVPD